MWLPLLLSALAADPDPGWPTHRADARRSGYTPTALDPPLVEHWRHDGAAPRPGWGEPARGSFWQNLEGLTARVTFDRVHAPVADAEVVIIGSSSDDQVRCFDLMTGRLRWAYLAGAAVRLAPVLDGERVLFGADDGTVSALARDDGALIWCQRLAPEARLVPARGRLASIWPVRSGLVIDGDEVFASAGLFPGQGVALAALETATGVPRWRVEASGVSPQGYLLVSSTRLYVPSGRATPFVFDRADGRALGQFGGPGGAWALLASEEEFVSGPGNSGELALAGAHARDRLATFEGRRMVVTPGLTYLQTNFGVHALDREGHVAALRDRAALASRARAGEDVAAALAEVEQRLAACVPWTTTTSNTDSMIVAGATVVVGGDGQVQLLDAGTGAERERLAVNGRALALAVSGGRLLVATDQGTLHAFAPGTPGELARHPSLPASSRANVAAWLAAAPTPRKGYAALFGASADQAASLADATEYTVALVPADADAARGRLVALGCTGRVQIVEDPATLTDYLANLVVAPESAAAEARRVLRPEGGVLLLDGVREVRGPLEGAGSWSHAYGDAGNSACSDDDLAGGALRLQWYGGPGPRAMIDRHLRTAPPLLEGGVLYLPAFDRIVACDAYNGTVLWERDVRGLSRTGFPLDGGYLAADAVGVWCAAEDGAHLLDGRTGAERAHLVQPMGEAWHWLALAGDAVLGSAGAADAPRRDQSRTEVEDQYRDQRPLVCSEGVFRHGAWTHPGTVPTATLAVAEGRVLFVESRAPAAARLTLDELLTPGADLVALDLETGVELWRRPFETRGEAHVLYVSAARGRVVTVGSYDGDDRVWYRVRVHDARDGRELWSATHGNNRAGLGGSHGEQVHHPILRGGTLIAEPLAYDLETGAVVDPTGGDGWSISQRSGCGTISASNHAVFFRDSHPTILDLVPGGGRRKLTEVTRPGCWINVLPAGGLVLVPEASSGCVCAYPVQTSLAFLPVGAGK